VPNAQNLKLSLSAKLAHILTLGWPVGARLPSHAKDLLTQVRFAEAAAALQVRLPSGRATFDDDDDIVVRTQT